VPVNLSEPKKSVALDKAKVMKVVIELNPRMRGPYIDVYLVWGRDVEGQFVEQIDPETTAEAQYYRIAPGQNPTARPSFAGGDQSGEGPALGKCDVCGIWHTRTSGPCSEAGCNGEVKPYDGFQRLAAKAPDGSNLYDSIANAIYGFLTTEQVPDPATGEIKHLLAAE
jgi:hypothetical protein